MTIQEKIQELEKLHKEGKTAELIEKGTEFILNSSSEAPEIYKAGALMACGYYRQKDFENAREFALRVLKHKKEELAIRCLAAIAAYHDKDSKMMKYYTDQLPESPARDNAFMIYARELSDTTPKEEIIERATKWMKVAIQDRVNTANLMNNTSRWFLAKYKTFEDLVMSLGFMQVAIGLYGVGNENLHHRASAWFWVSNIQEKLFDKKAAISAAEMSVKLWQKQTKLDPKNQNFLTSYEGAKKRLKELKA